MSSKTAVLCLAGAGVILLLLTTRTPPGHRSAAPAPELLPAPRRPSPAPRVSPPPAPATSIQDAAPRERGVPDIPGASLFAGTNVLAFSLVMDAAAIRRLRAQPRGWVRATLTFGSEVYSDVAVHIKGSQGSLQSIDERPALTVSFNRFVKGRRLDGLRKIHFNNTAEDPTFLMEILCGELCRQAGLPSARSAHATLRLNGRALGLYVVKEGLTSEFLEQYFTDTSGNLYDGGFRRDINRPLERIGGKGPPDQSDRLALLGAAREPDPERRWERLQEVLDVDRFISLLAMSTIMWNWDGYPMSRNNYRIYHDPLSRKMVFIPHGLDQMFWEAEGTIFPPMRGIVAAAVMSVPEGQRLYRQRLATLHSTVFRVPDLHRRADTLVALIVPYRRDAVAQGERLKAQMAKRWHSIAEQLEGKPARAL